MFSVFLEFSGLQIPDNPIPMICSSCVTFLQNYLEMKTMVVANSEYFMQFIVKNELDEGNVILPLCKVVIPKLEYFDTNDVNDADDAKMKSKVTEKPQTKKKPKIQVIIRSCHWCQYCFQSFLTKKLLQQHLDQELKANGGMVCEHCGFRNTNREYFITHMKRMHILHRFTCNRCSKSYPTNGELIQHVNIEHLNTRFPCPICGKTLTRKSRLLVHIKDVHEKQRPEICTQCGKGFSTRTQLKTHTTQVHTNLKPYPCSFCDKAFSSQSNRIVHEQIHSNEKFSCEQCDYTTNTVFNLRRHLIKHQDIYKYTCATCGQQFKTSVSLNLHQYTHQENSAECEYCHKKFSRPQSLKIHIDSVHLHKRYYCPKCNEEFSSMACMKKHVKFQHDMVRFFCKCGKYYDRRTRYTKHGEECHLAAKNEPEIKSLHSDEIYRAPPGRPAKFKDADIQLSDPKE